MKHKTMVATLAALAMSAVAVGDITPDGSETDKVSGAACVALWPDGQMPDRQAEQVKPFLVWHTPRERISDLCLIAVPGDADVYSAMGSVRVYHKLRTMGIPAELHVYAQVPHAFGADDGKVPEPPLWWDEAWLWLGKIQPKP